MGRGATSDGCWLCAQESLVDVFIKSYVVLGERIWVSCMQAQCPTHCTISLAPRKLPLVQWSPSLNPSLKALPGNWPRCFPCASMPEAGPSLVPLADKLDEEPRAAGMDSVNLQDVSVNFVPGVQALLVGCEETGQRCGSEGSRCGVFRSLSTHRSRVLK